MKDLDIIREAIIKKFKLKESTTKIQAVEDYAIITGFLASQNNVIDKSGWLKIQTLMLNFSTNSNILALRIIYNNYVK
jgi:hypothetical protein